MSGLSKHAPKSQLNPSAEIKQTNYTRRKVQGKKKLEQVLKGLIRSFGVLVFVDVLVSGFTSMFVCEKLYAIFGE